MITRAAVPPLVPTRPAPPPPVRPNDGAIRKRKDTKGSLLRYFRRRPNKSPQHRQTRVGARRCSSHMTLRDVRRQSRITPEMVIENKTYVDAGPARNSLMAIVQPASLSPLLAEQQRCLM